MPKGDYNAEKLDAVRSDRSADIALGSGQPPLVVLRDVYTMLGTEIADQTVDFFTVPRGYVVHRMQMRSSDPLGATATVDVGLVETLGDEDVIDEDAFFAAEDMSGAGVTLAFFPESSGPVGEQQQAQDTVVQAKFETLLTPAAGSELSLIAECIRVDTE